MFKLILSLLILCLCSFITPQNHQHEMKDNMKIPESLKIEHQKLHSVLSEAVKEKGELGKAAKDVEDALHPHFVKEEEIAMPPLSLLPELSEGKISDEMKSYLKLTDQLKSELPQMLKEHKDIVTVLDKFQEIAEQQNKVKYVEFAKDLKLHAKTEEEVTYPTSILIGEYLKLKLK